MITLLLIRGNHQSFFEGGDHAPFFVWKKVRPHHQPLTVARTHKKGDGEAAIPLVTLSLNV